MNWWHYLLLVNIYLLLFYGFYTLMLRRETFFQLNRIYLVSTAVLSFAIPLIQSQWVQNMFITQQVQYAVYSSGAIAITAYEPIKDQPYTLGELLTMAYLSGAAFLTIRLVWQLFKLNRVLRATSKASFSFFNTIRVDKGAEGSDIILKHEEVHARQWHSADVLIIEAVMILNWFNPVVYLYRFAIKHIHEFIADRQAVQAGTNKAEYALLLLNQTFEAPAHHLVNPFFNHSLLKQRIMMLQKNKSQRIKLAKYGLSAPLFVLMLILSSATINNSKAIKTINSKAAEVMERTAGQVLSTTVKTDTAMAQKPGHMLNEGVIVAAPGQGKKEAAAITAQRDKPALTDVDEMPQYPGGIDAFSKYVAKQVRYPVAARNAKVQGRVILSFVIEADGKVNDVKVMRGIGYGADEEAARVVRESADWIPGKKDGQAVATQLNVPVTFALEPNVTTTENKVGAIVQQQNSEVFTAVEQQPSFTGGWAAFQKYLSANIKYPANAKQNRTQGKVIVTFIVEKDGSLSNLKVIRSVGDGTDEEALRVLQASPKWIPGKQNGHTVRVAYTIPINFSLDGKQNDQTSGQLHAETETATSSIHTDKTTDLYVGTDKSTFIKKTGAPDPLLIVDDKEVPYNTIKILSPQRIESVAILKDKSAKAIYGDKGANGVIIVKTKKM